MLCESKLTLDMCLDNFSFSFLHERVISYAKKKNNNYDYDENDIDDKDKHVSLCYNFFSVQNFEME